MNVKARIDSTTMTMATMKVQLYIWKFPFDRPRSRRQNHSNEIFVKHEAQEKVIWNVTFNFSTVGIHSSGRSHICRLKPQSSVATDVTTPIAIANIRPITIKRSSIPGVAVIRSRVYSRSAVTIAAIGIQIAFTIRTP